jgi:1,4-dihydroxy-2-naphthoate octaprenyltransferase
VLLSAVLLFEVLLSAAEDLLDEASALDDESSPQAVSIDPTMQRLSAPARTLLSFAIIISSLNIALYNIVLQRYCCKILMPLFKAA